MNCIKPGFIQKVFIVSILIFFVIPIATAFCCCKSGDHHQEKSAHHEHGEHHHQESHDHGQDHGQDGCECGFESIAVDATIPTTHFFQLSDSILQWSAKSFTLNQDFSKYQFRSTSSYLEGESPPGARFHSTPLFLQLETLRI